MEGKPEENAAADEPKTLFVPLFSPMQKKRVFKPSALVGVWSNRTGILTNYLVHMGDCIPLDALTAIVVNIKLRCRVVDDMPIDAVDVTPFGIYVGEIVPLGN
ncbi:hypothetical protein BDZ45DRAFT_738449 [Acephala macrosclerotiorum]|nr:hypothetical protein BDZ45DRAFT_738449 [Acephala macrosclerotiorum]